jgi:UDPglucose--hexose-1-phosphate uridylyltransferase
MSELRKDPITGRWVIIATERAKRPLGIGLEPEAKQEEIDPFLPGNEHLTPPEIMRYADEANRNWALRVIPNKFPALTVEGQINREGVGLYDMMSGIGAHEVIIDTPDPDKRFAQFNEHEMELVFRAFRDRMNDLSRDFRLQYALAFKNEGRLAGATQQHSHSQMIALPIVPKTVQEELTGAREYYEFKGRNVYLDIVNQELRYGERLVTENPDFVVIAPFASRFPFALWVMPRRHAPCFSRIRDDEMTFLAKIFCRTMKLLDRALGVFAYNFVIHTSPLQDCELPYYHWHIEITPRLTRMGGFEAGSGFYINPTPPEKVAEYLRNINL